MPKAYWIAHVKADDDEVFASPAYQAYVTGARPAFEEFGAKFLARGGGFVQVEGDKNGSRHVVIEFPSLDAAKACYNSEVYAQAKQHRLPVANASILLLEGIE